MSYSQYKKYKKRRNPAESKIAQFTHIFPPSFSSFPTYQYSERIDRAHVTNPNQTMTQFEERNRQSLWRNHFNLKELRPQLSCNEQPLGSCVIGNAIQNIDWLPAVFFSQESS